MVKDEKGSSGFFEEVVLFAIVSILFVASLAVAVYYEGLKNVEYQKVEFVNEVHNFVNELREYQKLIHDSVEGLYDHHKITGVTWEEIRRDLNPNFNFTIYLIDVSDYKVKYNASWGHTENMSYAYYKIVVYYPANIWVTDYEIHAAKLKVIAWK